MKVVPLRKGLFGLLILEAVIITLVAIAFMFKLYQIYTNLVYNESALVLNLHSIITDAKLSEIENLSLEVLSNPDIQTNLLTYYNSVNQYERYLVANDLYTQLFSRCIMNKRIISISFLFRDGKQVATGHLYRVNLSAAALERIVQAAEAKDGAGGWLANVAGANIVTHYRLIKDISGNKFKPLGTLIINIDADYLLNHTSTLSEKYNPQIICVAQDEILSPEELNIKPGEILRSVNMAKPWEIVKLNREPYFISLKKLARNGWDLVYMLSTKNMLRSIKKTNLLLAVVLLLIVALVIIIGYYYANAISRPLTRLTKAMKVVEAGDYTVTLDHPDDKSPFAVAEVAGLARDFSRMVQQINYLVNEVYTKQLLIMEMKYKMLQQQINPHFLYNTLDTINWKAVESGNEEISLMVKALSKLFRCAIKGPDLISLGEDLGLVADYIQIQKIRFEERLDYKEEISPAVYSCKIPRLTLQPIVENCIIHNLEKYAGVCRIRLTSTVRDGQLIIGVEDNGRGIDLDHIKRVLSGQVPAANKRIGLKNIDQRIKISFGEEYGIAVEKSEPSGTRVNILLPYGGIDNADTLDCR